MQIIIHAGNARNLCSQAIDKAEAEDFQEANKLMSEAEEVMLQAHISQTNIIQDEARGKEYPHSLLFTHAQDTLMTIKSELNMGKKFILVFKKIAHSK
ncbi:TPA_asm: PTS lactose/cellobiose transporter subunit IIA [Listeria monocytogenes]|nr:PTS lactose/cellobiose transporter subunit IIA [Listeria monocytogenes]